MLEDDVVEFHRAYARNFDGICGPRLLRHLEDGFEVVQRHFGLAIDVHHVSDFLQRAEDKKRINPAGEKLPHTNLSGKNQIQHQTEDRRPHGIDTRALDKTEAAKIFHLFEFQFQDLARRTVQSADFLLRQTEAFHELDVTKRFRRRSGKRRRLSHDHLLDFLDLPAEYRNQRAEHRNGQKVNQSDQPVNGQRIDHHKNNANQRYEQDVHDRVRQPLHIRPDFLKLPQGLAAALVFEVTVGQLQRMLDAIGIDARTQPLGYD